MENKNLTLKIVAAVAGVILLAGLVYFAMKSSKLEDENVKLAENEVELQKEIKQLDEKLRVMETDLQNKTGQVEEKDKKIEELTKQLDNAKKSVNYLASQGKLKEKQLSDFQAKMGELEGTLKKYAAEIEELKKKNAELQTENQDLKTNLQSKDSLSQVKTEEASLYKTKLESASTLKVGDFEYLAVKKNGKEERDIEFRKGKLDHLRICAQVMENAAATAGSKDLYLVIKDPSGNVYSPKDGKPSFKMGNIGNQLYSAKTTVNYNLKKVRVCFDYIKPDKVDFLKGKQDVIVYSSEGYEIGRGTMMVSGGIF